MSYCVNCGVELAASERKCPLCDTEVINPKSPWEAPKELPYPARIEYIQKRMHRRFLGELLSVLLLIPVFICLLCDLIASGGISWSAIVVGAIALVFLWLVLPLLLRMATGLRLLVGCAATILYLLLIEVATGGDWFLMRGLPIALCAELFFSILVLTFEKKSDFRLLAKAAIVLFSTGIFTLCLEIILGAARGRDFVLAWSPYVLIPCCILGASSLFIDSKPNLKEEIRRRLFF